MAYALLLSKTFGVSTPNNGVFTFTSFGATIPAGTLLDIGVGGNLDSRPGVNNTKVLSVSDNSSQAGDENIYVPIQTSPGGTTDGLMRIRCFTTRDILTGDTITVTCSSSGTGLTMSRRSGLLLAFSGASASTSVDKTAIQSARSASPVTMGATAALAEAASLAVAMSSWRGGAVASGFSNSTGGYTAAAGASSGGTTTRVEVNGAYKLSAGTAAETDAHAFTSFTAGCGMIVTYRPNGYTEEFQAPNFTVLDNFNTGASQNVDARSGWGSGRINSGNNRFATDATPTAAAPVGTPCSNVWGSLLDANQECWATMGSSPDNLYLMCRGDTASGVCATGYIADIGWQGEIQIWKVDGTVLASIAADATFRPAAGDTYVFSCIGTTLTVWRRPSGGVPQIILTVQDSSYSAAGYIGMLADSGSTVNVTDFGGEGYPVGGGTVSDSGTSSLTITPTGAETIRDAATQPVVITPTGTETIRDAGTCTIGIAASASEQIQEPAATAIIGVSQTASQALVDSGVQTVVITPTGADALVDGATQAFSLTQSASEQIQDAGTNTMVVSQTHTTLESDAGTAVIGIAASGADMPVDQGTQAIVIAASGSDALVDGDTAIIGVDASYTGGPSGSDSGTGLVVVDGSGVEMLSDSGVCTFGIAASGSQALADAGFSALAIAATAVETVVLADAGTAAIGIAAAATETLRDAGTQPVVIAASGAESAIDRGTSVVAISQSAAEQIRDAGTQPVVIAPTAVDTVVTADAGTAIIGIAASAAEGYSEAGTNIVGIAATGAPTIRDAGSVTFVVDGSGVSTPFETATAEFSVDGAAALEAIVEPVGVCTFSVTQTAAHSVATVDAGTVTFSITQTYKTGEAGTVTFSIVGGSVATERIMDSGTLVFAISEKASSSSGIDLGTGSPYSLDRARRARLRATTARTRANEAQNPWRRDRSLP